MARARGYQIASTIAAAVLCLATAAHAAEHVTLHNGFAFDCLRREAAGDTVRLFLLPSNAAAEGNYLDVPASEIVLIEPLQEVSSEKLSVAGSADILSARKTAPEPTLRELSEMLSRAGAAHHIDADLLASVVHAESGGRSKAVSRAGARGLMQLMPATATALGVKDSFVAAQNVEGGTRYLDDLLTRYHDNIALALAAYNAGPGAVDRFHGVPPFRETRAYVARIIREFNRRKSILVARR